ncbi:MAG: hypothetical protein ACRD6I_12905 [Candidatus Acidiferrales bacterium]
MKMKLRKTTLVLHDALVAELKREALRLDGTMSEVVESALRLFFERQAELREKKLHPLPTFDGGGEPLVDIADRNALYEKMGGRW